MKLSEVETLKTYRPEIFLDMDGVLADFFAEYAKLAGVSSYREIPPASRDLVLKQIEGTNFFFTLPKFPQKTDALVNLATRLFGHYNICSSPLRGDHTNSEHWKKQWIKKNLNPQPKHIFITPNKGTHAVQPDGTRNILVDDRGAVISEWEDAGGIGIKYQADEDSLQVVVDGLKRALAVIKGDTPYQHQGLISLDRKTGAIAKKV